MATTTKLENPSINPSWLIIIEGIKIIKDQKKTIDENKIKALLLLLNFDLILLIKKIFSWMIKFLYSCKAEPQMELVVPNAEIKIVIVINIVIPNLTFCGNESKRTFKIVVPLEL